MRLSIRETTWVYETCAEAKIHEHEVVFRALGSFNAAVRNFIRYLGEEADDPYWRGFVGFLKRSRYLFQAAPLPLDHPIVCSSERIASVRERLLLADAAFPQHSERARGVLGQLEKLSLTPENPFLQQVYDLVHGFDEAVGLLVNEPHVIPAVEELKTVWPGWGNVMLLGPAQLRGGFCCRRLVVLGPARWYHGSDHVFCAPRADELHIVRLAGVRDTLPSSKVFALSPVTEGTSDVLDSEVHKTTVSDDGEWEAEAIDAGELLPLTDWSALAERDAVQGDTAERLHEVVQARGYVLEGGCVVYLDASEQGRVLIVEIVSEGEEETPESMSGTPHAGIVRMPARQMEPGDFVLLRTAGGGDYILPLANRIMGDSAKPARQMQEAWKERLWEKFFELRMDGLVSVLKDAGSTRATRQNVFNWMRSDTIRPKDKVDFVAIMRVIGALDRIDSYWSNAKTIEGAHKSAGFQIRKMLLKQVRESDLTELERTGRMEFELPEADGGSMTAFRVREVSPRTYSIQRMHLGRVMASEGDDAWQ